MKALLNQLQETADVFTSTTEDQIKLVKEYFDRKERVKEDEKWLDSVKPVIVKILMDLGRDKMDFEDVRVSVVVPDLSGFDKEALAEYLHHLGYDDLLEIRYVVNEEALQAAIEHERIDIEELKKVAWVERKGSPRLSVKKVTVE